MKNLLFVVIFLVSTNSCIDIPNLNPSESNIVVNNAPYWVCYDVVNDIRSVEIDINQDGLVDFIFDSSIFNCYDSPGNQAIYVSTISGLVEQNEQEVRNEIVTKINSINPLINNDLTVGFTDNQVYSQNLGNGIFWKKFATNYFNIDACTSSNAVYSIFPENNSNENSFIVVRFKIDGKFHYGWIEFNAFCGGARMAYNTVPGLRVQPGQLK